MTSEPNACLTQFRIKVFCFLLFFALPGFIAPAAAKTPGEVEIGATLRDAPMQGLSGTSRLLSDYRGKPLIINVWASWCEPCRKEMASLDRLARRYGGRQFNVIGISTDDYRDLAGAFLKRANSTFEHFIDHQLVLENMLGADKIPLTLLIDAQGRVRGKHYGAKEWDSPAAKAVIAKTLNLTL
jgi:thiol-disulfide isomerase/thioredoxin